MSAATNMICRIKIYLLPVKLSGGIELNNYMGSENGYGMDGIWIVNPLTETSDYYIPILFPYQVIMCWEVWLREHMDSSGPL